MATNQPLDPACEVDELPSATEIAVAATQVVEGLRFLPLAEPIQATERPHRRHGLGRFLRTFEHDSSHWLSLHVYGRIPGLRRIYDRSLRADLTVATAEIAVPALPEPFDGLGVLLLTDVHAGPFVSAAALAQAFDRIRAIEADLILLGGDLVTCRARELDDLAPLLRSLAAPLGCFAVLGNHDHATGAPEEVRARVRACGIECLDNRSVVLERQGARLTLAGIDDLRHGRPDLARALRATEPPVLLLSHHPDVAFDAARAGVALVLSGHTHGGQVVVPGLPLLVRQSRHGLDAGRYRCGSTEVVVSRGLGVVGIPLRVGSPAEVVRLTLRRG
jgi:predicted MPP superfamily phosphohydrolase